MNGDEQPSSPLGTVTAHSLSECETQSINLGKYALGTSALEKVPCRGPQLSYAGARGIGVPAEGSAERVIAAEPHPPRTWAHGSKSRAPAAEV